MRNWCARRRLEKPRRSRGLGAAGLRRADPKPAVAFHRGDPRSDGLQVVGQTLHELAAAVETDLAGAPRRGRVLSGKTVRVVQRSASTCADGDRC